jgi:hypothetical protein
LVSPPIPAAPAVVSFDLRWMGNKEPTSGTDTTVNQFTYQGIMTRATLAWTASVPSTNFKFQSDAANTSKETFAELVNERNGSFFSSDGDDD